MKSINTTINIKTHNPIENIIGLKAQNHDIFILPNNFNVTKTIVNNPKNPTPPIDTVGEFATFIFLY